MWWLWLACSLPTVAVPQVDAIDPVLATDGWARTGCSRVRSEGVATTACTFRRPDEVALVTILLYDVAADAGRTWDAAKAAGWRDGRLVVQVDVFDEAAAREVLTPLPDGPPPGFDCVGPVCSQERGDRRVLVGPSRGGQPAPGYVVVGERTAAVQDLAAARDIGARLRDAVTQ